MVLTSHYIFLYSFAPSLHILKGEMRFILRRTKKKSLQFPKKQEKKQKNRTNHSRKQVIVQKHQKPRTETIEHILECTL